MAGDFSPVLPLTVADTIVLTSFQGRRIDRENDALLTLADIHWFLQRIALSITGNERWNEMPSNVMQMSRNYMERKKLWENQ